MRVIILISCQYHIQRTARTADGRVDIDIVMCLEREGGAYARSRFQQIFTDRDIACLQIAIGRETVGSCCGIEHHIRPVECRRQRGRINTACGRRDFNIIRVEQPLTYLASGCLCRHIQRINLQRMA